MKYLAVLALSVPFITSAYSHIDSKGEQEYRSLIRHNARWHLDVQLPSSPEMKRIEEFYAKNEKPALMTDASTSVWPNNEPLTPDMIKKIICG